MSRQAKRNAKLRAQGKCHCGQPATRSGRCPACYARYRERMRAYMAQRRAAAA